MAAEADIDIHEWMAKLGTPEQQDTSRIYLPAIWVTEKNGSATQMPGTGTAPMLCEQQYRPNTTVRPRPIGVDRRAVHPPRGAPPPPPPLLFTGGAVQRQPLQAQIDGQQMQLEAMQTSLVTTLAAMQARIDALHASLYAATQANVQLFLAVNNLRESLDEHKRLVRDAIKTK